MAEQGTVKFFKSDKGFGFISRVNADDCFVHIKDLRATGIATLTEGQNVTFDVVPGKDEKPKAVNVAIGNA